MCSIMKSLLEPLYGDLISVSELHTYGELDRQAGEEQEIKLVLYICHYRLAKLASSHQ